MDEANAAAGWAGRLLHSVSRPEAAISVSCVRAAAEQLALPTALRLSTAIACASAADQCGCECQPARLGSATVPVPFPSKRAAQRNGRVFGRRFQARKQSDGQKNVRHVFEIVASIYGGLVVATAVTLVKLEAKN